MNESLFLLIAKLLNGTELYKHQVADLIEPEKYSINGIHAVIWVLTILTYLLAMPVVLRMVLSRAYENLIDYFSCQIILCAFIAWIPALILLLHHWLEIFTSSLCRFHYVILSTNETVGWHRSIDFRWWPFALQVPIFFVLYMIVERFLYAHPSYKQLISPRWSSSMVSIHLLTIFTWVGTLLIYTVASPFYSRPSRLPYLKETAKFCLYNYSKLQLVATARSIIYFLLFVPAVLLIAFVLRYFFIMRGTNQIPPIQKLWTIRVAALLAILVFYDVYLYYLEHIAETFKSFVLASLLRASFYLTQLFIIACTESYWLEFLLDRCCCQRRARKPLETEFQTVPYASSTGHYSLVDETIDDEFDRAMNGPPPTLRVITWLMQRTWTHCNVVVSLFLVEDEKKNICRVRALTASVFVMLGWMRFLSLLCSFGQIFSIQSVEKDKTTNRSNQHEEVSVCQQWSQSCAIRPVRSLRSSSLSDRFSSIDLFDHRSVPRTTSSRSLRWLSRRIEDRKSSLAFIG